MKYQKNMEKLLQELNAYRMEVDNFAVLFRDERRKQEEHLTSMAGKYTESYIEECRRNREPEIDYSGLLSERRAKHQQVADVCLDEMQSELDKYFSVPVDSGFAATITAINSIGVIPTNREFELLKGSAGGYWGLRLLNESGLSRSKKEKQAALKDGKIETIDHDAKIPYAIDLPDIEKSYDCLQNVKNAVNVAFEAYIGVGGEFKDIIFPVKQGQMHDNMTIARMATAPRYFSEDWQAYTDFTEMMDGLAATMPQPKKKEVLTEDDRKLIDTLIDSRYTASAEKEAVRIAEADSRLAELLRLDERYKVAVEKALGGAEENE